MSWYAVRCIFHTPHGEGFSYEERVTLWQADDSDTAIVLAESEAEAYEFGGAVATAVTAQGIPGWAMGPGSRPPNHDPGHLYQ